METPAPDRLSACVAEVEALFQRLDDHIQQFQQATGLGCRWGCGACCFKPDIEATVLEFLPFAWHVYRAGEWDAWHSRACETDHSLCIILAAAPQGQGMCTQYVHRGLICRLFGFSARLNKTGMRELVTCTIIKTDQAAAVEGAPLDVAPLISDYYWQLHAIDPDRARQRLPIRQAIRQALEEVAHYYAYR